ncbi:Uncharacterized [Moorella glycerini]|uniref:Uncharacterized protein n=1 Tax=Neomoorella stamsii TaxID=1266720 RepID=A0A9X7J572_9FIRM|nr:hypothetical protein MOST_11620 [Moorella stamsii]PRR74032.1 hypothetical protein MOST_11730 [Moorella stamsii]CEP66848.1 Uncharacterized [Moorella glycerini]CEP67433.1 Uncharacterized [Moorella glycerini]
MEEKKAELALRLETLERALATLEEALAQPFSVIVRYHSTLRVHL